MTGGTMRLRARLQHRPRNEHYGNTVTHMRMKGLAPPSSARNRRSSAQSPGEARHPLR